MSAILNSTGEEIEQNNTTVLQSADRYQETTEERTSDTLASLRSKILTQGNTLSARALFAVKSTSTIIQSLSTRDSLIRLIPGIFLNISFRSGLDPRFLWFDSSPWPYKLLFIFAIPVLIMHLWNRLISPALIRANILDAASQRTEMWWSWYILLSSLFIGLEGQYVRMHWPHGNLPLYNLLGCALAVASAMTFASWYLKLFHQYVPKYRLDIYNLNKGQAMPPW